MNGRDKRIYGFKTNYQLLDTFLSNIGDIKKARDNHAVSDMFEKRIMMAVTQVNGCSICSYFHTKEALKMGMSEHEIQNLLAGDMEDVPEEEAAALIFAQHYADTIGQYDKDAWNRVVTIYGRDRAVAILAYIRAIMFGNAQGNIFEAIKSRIKGQPVPNSTFFMEIAVILSDIFVMPFLLIKAAFLALAKKISPRKHCDK